MVCFTDHESQVGHVKPAATVSFGKKRLALKKSQSNFESERANSDLNQIRIAAKETKSKVCTTNKPTESATRNVSMVPSAETLDVLEEV